VEKCACNDTAFFLARYVLKRCDSQDVGVAMLLGFTSGCGGVRMYNMDERYLPIWGLDFKKIRPHFFRVSQG